MSGAVIASTANSPQALLADYLVISLGGTGGSAVASSSGVGGHGGAGGYKAGSRATSDPISLAPGSYALTIDGTGSSIATLVVTHKGGGGGFGGLATAGGNGGSGGGAGNFSTSAGGTGIVGEGHDGGANNGGGSAGGGGGSSTAASFGSNGLGTANSITGSSITYANGANTGQFGDGGRGANGPGGESSGLPGQPGVVYLRYAGSGRITSSGATISTIGGDTLVQWLIGTYTVTVS